MRNAECGKWQMGNDENDECSRFDIGHFRQCPFDLFGIRHSAFSIDTYSHSMVEGGLLLMSYTTRLMPFTSLTMRDEMQASSSCGRRAQSAVIPSLLSTARIATVYSYV